MFSKFRSLIFKFDPETAHNLAIKSLKFNFVPNIFDENKNNPNTKNIKVSGLGFRLKTSSELQVTLGIFLMDKV